jgi:hypothetical protein
VTTGAPQQFPFSRQSAGPAPLRRPGSVRRTTSIDSEWPEGYGQPWLMTGRARDLLTPADNATPVVLDTAGFQMTVSPIREIQAVETSPAHPRAPELVGVRAGGASRVALGEIMGDARGTPLFQLLDDFAGASLVAGWIWSQWTDDWMAHARRSGGQATAGNKGRMNDICTGFAEGSSAFKPDGTPDNINQSSAEVGPLENPDDAAGWHAMPHNRARRNVAREGSTSGAKARRSRSMPGSRTAAATPTVGAPRFTSIGSMLKLMRQPADLRLCRHFL